LLQGWTLTSSRSPSSRTSRHSFRRTSSRKAGTRTHTRAWSPGRSSCSSCVTATRRSW